MDKMNYALAPSGATHEYNGMWRKLEGDKWYAWIDGEWGRIVAVCSDDYEPIPEREQALNRLADATVTNYDTKPQEWANGFPPVSLLHEKFVYEKETGLILKKSNGLSACYSVKKKKKTYLRIGLMGKRFYAHRVAWAMHYGEWPLLEIDHINGDSEDNCIMNLRQVTRKQNCQNVKTSSKSLSGYCGVNWHSLSGKWRARVKMDGR